MSAPRVSVVVTTYQRRALLGEALEAVLAQSFRDFEVIVVDNESTDGTADYIAEIADPRVRSVRHANHGLIAVNRNVGIREARGEWVAFCDDDDVWLPGKLEQQMAFIDANPEVGVVCSNAVQFDGAEEYGRAVRRRGDAWLTIDDMLSARCDVLMSTALVRRDVFERVGLFDEARELMPIEDYELFVRISAAGVRTYFADDVLVRYRVHSGGASQRDGREQAAKERFMFSRLRAAGVLDEAQARAADENVGALMRRARAKELLKRVPGLRRLVYVVKRGLHRGTASDDA